MILFIKVRRTSGCRGRGTWSASRSTAAPCRSAWSWTARAGATSPPGRGRGAPGSSTGSGRRCWGCGTRSPSSGPAPPRMRSWSSSAWSPGWTAWSTGWRPAPAPWSLARPASSSSATPPKSWCPILTELWPSNILPYFHRFVTPLLSRSDVRGYILPALGLSDWKHSGVVQLYQKVQKTW